jgi:tetratricopeptide (TPR) repeat protein
MFRRKDDASKSPYPISLPEREGESYEDFLNRLQRLFEDADQDKFWEAIDSAPARWQRKPEFMLARAVALMRDGDRMEAKKIFDEIERTHPRFAPLYFYKASLYMEDVFPAHTLRMIGKLHSMGTMDDESEQAMKEMETIARQLIQESADSFGVSYEKMEKASWYHEAAQEKMNAGQWGPAEQMAREALRQIPGWTSPRNNRAYVLFFMGKIDEALKEAQGVLAQQPDNVYALKNLVIFYTGLGEDENARQSAARMAAQLQHLPPDAVEVDAIISALGLVNDDETLWTLAQKYLKRDFEDLFETSWFSLGVAAVRTGHLREAKKLLEMVEEYDERAQSLAADVRRAIKAGKSVSPKPGHSTIGLLLPALTLNELIEMLGKYGQEDRLPPHIQKKLEDYIEKRPFVVNGLLHLLNEPGASEAVPHLLLQFNKPEIDARLRSFALGDVGTKQQRLNVLTALAEMGREVPPNPVRFWDEEAGEWREVDFSSQMLSDDIELNISPKASVWAQKAQAAEKVDDKIAFWRKAVEADPKSGYAVHMLGVLLMQNGQKEEGKRLARRAIEVDPGYIFAYANLALMEAQEEDPKDELIREYLEKVAKAPVITAQTAFLMHFALMLQAFHRRDFEAARREYQIAFELYPENPLLEGWDLKLKLGEVFAGGWLSNWAQESYQRAHDKAMRTKLDVSSGASVTLNSLSREVLGAVARVWGLTAYGKKAELVKKIVEQMHDRNAVEGVCNALSHEQKDALQWTLQNGGWRGWKEFTDKYGDDSEESPYWNYHEPESVVGCLRRSGFLAKGTLNGEQVVFIPADVRTSLKDALQ